MGRVAATSLVLALTFYVCSASLSTCLLVLQYYAEEYARIVVTLTRSPLQRTLHNSRRLSDLLRWSLWPVIGIQLFMMNVN